MGTGAISSVVRQQSQGNNQASNHQSIVATATISGSFLMRNGLRRALEGTQFSIVRECSVLPPERHLHRGSEAALIIVDATEPSEAFLEPIRRLRQQRTNANIVALIDQVNLSLLGLGREAGVDSFCLASSAPEVLINILELTMLGEKFVPGTLLQRLLTQEYQPPSASEQRERDSKAKTLSPREAVILQSLMGGDANKVIARKLDITEATIKVHVKSILRKIGAANRTQAAMWATENLPLSVSDLRRKG